MRKTIKQKNEGNLLVLTNHPKIVYVGLEEEFFIPVERQNLPKLIKILQSQIEKI